MKFFLVNGKYIGATQRNALSNATFCQTLETSRSVSFIFLVTTHYCRSSHAQNRYIAEGGHHLGFCIVFVVQYHLSAQAVHMHLGQCHEVTIFKTHLTTEKETYKSSSR